MKHSLLAAVTLTAPAVATDGMISVESPYSTAGTVERLEKILQDKGMTVFARKKHSEAAGKIGVELRETELVIFGNPKVGSALMQCEQSAAIDLPQKALIWRDAKGRV